MPSIPVGPLGRRALVLAAALAAALAGCERSSSVPAPESAGRDVLFPDGRTVHVRSPALHVFAASASVVDFLSALAPPERIAAIPEQASDYADVPDSAAWRGVPRFTSYVAETVLARAPDLVLAEPVQSKDTSERLKSAGIEVVVLPEVRTWQDARATLCCVGELLSERPRAEALARELDRRVALLAEKPGPRRGLRALSYSNFGTGGSSAGPGTTLHEQIVLAGMRNAFAELGREGHAALTFEELIALDPDLILVSQPLHGGEGTQGDRGGASGRLLRTEPSLEGLRAVRLDRIVELPPSLFATGSQRIVDAAEALAAAVDQLLARASPPGEHR